MRKSPDFSFSEFIPIVWFWCTFTCFTCRYNKTPRWAPVSSRCYLVNCNCDGPVTPDQNVSWLGLQAHSRIVCWVSGESCRLFSQNGHDTAMLIRQGAAAWWMWNRNVCHWERNVVEFYHTLIFLQLFGQGDNAPGQDWVKHINPCDTTICYFYN